MEMINGTAISILVSVVIAVLALVWFCNIQLQAQREVLDAMRHEAKTRLANSLVRHMEANGPIAEPLEWVKHNITGGCTLDEHDYRSIVVMAYSQYYPTTDK